MGGAGGRARPDPPRLAPARARARYRGPDAAPGCHGCADAEASGAGGGRAGAVAGLSGRQGGNTGAPFAATTGERSGVAARRPRASADVRRETHGGTAKHEKQTGMWCAACRCTSRQPRQRPQQKGQNINRTRLAAMMIMPPMREMVTTLSSGS